MDFFPHGYFYVFDSLNHYGYTLSLLSVDGKEELSLDSMVYIPDTFVIKLTLFEDNTPVDSLSQIFKPNYRLGIGDDYALPGKYALHPNFPNPFNPVTMIHYELPLSSQVRLSVYDILGREVAVLINKDQNPGIKTIQWNASTVPSGIYFVQMQAGDFRQVRKVMVLK